MANEYERIANLLLLMGAESVPVYEQFKFHATDKLYEYLIDIEDLDLTRCIQRVKKYVSQRESAAKLVAAGDNVDAEGKYTPRDFAKIAVPQTTEMAEES